jgi:hypothetical protein
MKELIIELTITGKIGLIQAGLYLEEMERKNNTFLEWMYYIKHNDYANLEGEAE